MKSNRAGTEAAGIEGMGIGFALAGNVRAICWTICPLATIWSVNWLSQSLNEVTPAGMVMG